MVFGGDPTPLAIRNGRIAFNDAAGSTTGTFSCASCHPDGHVDQLLWVIGAQCTFGGLRPAGAAHTMPVRGLKNTLPLHWDGTLGDPFDGRNGETGVNATAPANCSATTRLLPPARERLALGRDVHAGRLPEQRRRGGRRALGRRARRHGDLPPEHPVPARAHAALRRPAHRRGRGRLLGLLREQGRREPARRKRATVPRPARDDGPGGCHALPHGVGTASFFVGGFEAPTMRGITDRFLQFSAGVTVVRDVLEAVSADPPGPTGPGTEVPWSPAVGLRRVHELGGGVRLAVEQRRLPPGLQRPGVRHLPDDRGDEQRTVGCARASADVEPAQHGAGRAARDRGAARRARDGRPERRAQPARHRLPQRRRPHHELPQQRLLPGAGRRALRARS